MSNKPFDQSVEKLQALKIHHWKEHQRIGDLTIGMFALDITMGFEVSTLRHKRGTPISLCHLFEKNQTWQWLTKTWSLRLDIDIVYIILCIIVCLFNIIILT